MSETTNQQTVKGQTMNNDNIEIDSRRDLGTEAFLDSFGVTYTLQEVPLASIKTEASRANQARSLPLNPENVNRLASARSNGAVFPPIVVRDGLILDGNHRHQVGLDAGDLTIWAYVVNCTTVIAEDIIAVANSRNGERNTPAETRLHIIRMVRAKRTQGEVARMFNTSTFTVSKLVRAAEARDRLNRPNLASELNDSVLNALAKISSDQVFREACRVAVRLNMTEAIARDLVGTIAIGAPERQQLEQLEAFAATLEPPKRRNAATKSPVWHLKMGLGKVISADANIIGREANGTAQELRVTLNDAKRRIDEILGAL